MKRKILLLAGIASCLLLAGPAIAAEGCASIPPGRFSLYFMHDEQPDIGAIGSDELAALREGLRRSEQGAPYVDNIRLVQDVSPLRIELEIDPRTSEVGGVCAAPDSIIVKIGFPARRILVLGEAAADECARSAILAHASRHLAFDKAELEGFFDRIRPEVAQVLAALRTAAPAPSAGEAIQGFRARLEQFFRAAALRFLHERRSGQALIDTPRETDTVRDACGSFVRRLEAAAGSR